MTSERRWTAVGISIKHVKGFRNPETPRTTRKTGKEKLRAGYEVQKGGIGRFY